jgi:hypothetical protein
MENRTDKTERIRDLIRSYGADFDRWPATEGLGRPHLNAELARLRAEERELDVMIESAHVPAPSDALRRRILDIPDRRSRHTKRLWILSGFWRPAGVAVGALVAGLFLGQLTLLQTGMQSNPVLGVTTVETETEVLFAELVLGPEQSFTDETQ